MQRWGFSNNFIDLYLLVAEGAEYECPTDEQFQQKNGRLCMSLSLACDGLPNCGENIIPNADEACFKVSHHHHVITSHFIMKFIMNQLRMSDNINFFTAAKYHASLSDKLIFLK